MRGRAAGIVLLAILLGSGCGRRTVEDAAGARELTAVVDSLNRLGHFLEASRAAEEQLRLRVRALGPDHLLVAESKHRLAEALNQQGSVHRAYELHTEALALRRRRLHKRDPLLGESLIQMAVAEKRIAIDKFRPIALFEEGLAILRAAHGDSSLEVARALNSFANLQRLLGKRSDARATFETALAIRRRLLPAGHPDIAETEADLALVLLLDDRAVEAEALLRPALEARLRVLGADHPDLAFTSSLLAGACLQQAKYSEAERYYRQTIRTYESFRTRIAPGFNRNRRYIHADNLMLAATLLLAGREREAWPHVEGTLGRVLLEELSAKGLYHGTASPPEDVPATVASLEQVQSALDEKSALVGWLDMNPWGSRSQSWAYVIRDHGDVRWVRLTSPASTSVGARSHRALADAAEWPLPVDPQARSEVADELYANKWARVEPELAGVQRLIVLASPTMGMVPVEAIRDPRGSFMGDRYAVSYAPSATVYAWLHRRSVDRPRPERALLVGDPAFSAGQARTMAREAQDGVDVAHLSPRTSLPEARILRDAADGTPGALDRLPRLPWTRHEIETMRSMFPHSAILTGPEATKQGFLRTLRSAGHEPLNVIHLATHGVSDLTLPDGGIFVMSRSTRSDAGDCLLRPGEIEALDLDVDLVSMSSCSSYGTLYSGSGFTGMGTAFLIAGARNVLVSFWRVEDRAAALLVEEFYRNYLERHLPMAESLQHAKQYLRSYTTADGKRPYEHPAYWSPFILVGSGS